MVQSQEHENCRGENHRDDLLTAAHGAVHATFLMTFASVSRMWAISSSDEISGGVITYDSGNETFSVQGAPNAGAGAGSGNGTGRVKVTIIPPPEKPGAASAPR